MSISTLIAFFKTFGPIIKNILYFIKYFIEQQKLRKAEQKGYKESEDEIKDVQKDIVNTLNNIDPNKLSDDEAFKGK